MPCRSDHMEANGREIESRVVAKHLVYILPIMGKELPAGVKKASTEYYGNPQKLDEWTALLCATCKELEADEALADEYLWDGRMKNARELAGWWENHKEFDRKREAEEAAEAEEENLQSTALDTIYQALEKAGVEGASIDSDNDSAHLSFNLGGKVIILSSRDVEVTNDE